MPGAIALARERMTAQLYRKTLGKVVKKRGNKFNAVKTTVGYDTFDSKREATEWEYLLSLQRLQEVEHLERQKKFDLVVNGVKIASYKADFAFFDVIQRRYRVIDVKSVATAKRRDFVLIKKLMRAIHKIEVEVWL